MSVARCQEEVSSSEFIEWEKYLEQEVNGFHRLDHFLAMIACEIRRSYIKNPGKVKVEDFMLEFETVKPEPYSMQASKRAWLTALGLGDKLKEEEWT